MDYIPPTSHVTLLATLRRERLLPVAGEVMVQLHQRVEATDVVARAYIPDGHQLVDVARQLGIPGEKADRLLVKHDGEAVKKGEPIAVRKTALGLARKEVRSPVDGRLVVAGEGKALLAAMSRPFELRAGIPGQIASVTPARGAAIETTGALLEGAWGNGHQDYGPMAVVGSGPKDALLSEQLDMGLRGNILAVGTLQDDAAFKQLAEVRIRGLIVGSLKSHLLSAVQRLRIPLLVVEGFGTQGFSQPAYELLTSNSGRDVWLSARPREWHTRERPEVIIPLPSPSAAPPAPAEGVALEVGQRVRIVRGGLETGRTGTILALTDRAVPTPSGSRTRVATVDIGPPDGAPLKVPFANLETLE